MKLRTEPTIDSADGYEYTPVSREVQTMMRRRFEDYGTTAVSDEDPNILLHNITNTWDGAFTVRVIECLDGSTVYLYVFWYDKRPDVFQLDGYYSTFNGEFHPW